jgi:hypothetical protein
LHDQIRGAIAEMKEVQYISLRVHQHCTDATVRQNLIVVAVDGLLMLALAGVAWMVINRGFLALRGAEA